MLLAFACMAASLAPLVGATILVLPDGALYLGVGKTLLATGEYADLVRKDEILPSIGHVLYVAALNGLGAAWPFIAALAVFSVGVGILAPRNIVGRIAAVALAFALGTGLSAYMTVGGVESSLILASSAFMVATVIFVASMKAWII